MKYIIRIFVFILLNEFIYSQNNTKIVFAENTSNLEKYLEFFVTEENDVENLLETIDYFSNNPLSLSNSTPNQIAQIPTISYFDAYFIFNYLQKNPTETINKIAEILNLNEYQKYILSICTEQKKPIEKQKFNAKIRERSFYQLEKANGYKIGEYVGEQWNLYQKYQLNYQTNFANISAGGTVNKNSGEKHLAEFFSGYFNFNHQNVKIIAGDFSVKTGMGNIFGENYTQSKGINIILPTVGFSNNILPYTLKMDYRLMRGISARLDFPLFDENRISSSIWYANSPRSATVSPDNAYVSSIFTSSSYKTENNIAKKNAIFEKNIGASLEFSGCNYNVGILLTYFDYDLPIRSTSSRAFAGKNGYMSSIFSSFYFDKINVSSELSLDNNSNFGLKFGTAYKSKEMEFALHIRSFEEKFRSPYGTIFGEFSYPANELGTYIGLIWKPEKKYKFSTYFDWFYTYENTYSVDTNVTGFEIFTQFDYSLSSETSFYLRLNYKSKTAEETVGKNIEFYQRDKLKFRVSGEQIFTKNFKLRSQIDFVFINNSDIIANEFGVAAFLEGTVRITNWLKFQGRTAYFSTDSYGSAIWQFEYYFPGYFYSPALYENGIRSYLAAQFSPTNWLEIHFRYVNLYKFDAESLGSGYETINSNQQNRIFCQFDFKI